jgi:hypothetical protein
MDNHAEVGAILRMHRRRRWWPWRCACGARYPCGPRLRAVDESVRTAAREAVEWYPKYFARRSHAEWAAADESREQHGDGPGGRVGRAS